MEQQPVDTDEESDVEICENWLEKLFDNFKIISDVMKVKLEQKCNLVNNKQERIFELENVLKTSVVIASERDKEYHKLVQIKDDLDIKVSILFLVFAHHMVPSKLFVFSSEFRFSWALEKAFYKF